MGNVRFISFCVFYKAYYKKMGRIVHNTAWFKIKKQNNNHGIYDEWILNYRIITTNTNTVNEYL